MRKSSTIKKLFTAITATVLGTAFTVGAGACAHKHTFAREWTVDGTYHWHTATCQHTDEVAGKAEHIYGNDDICDFCDYDRSTGTIAPPPSGGDTGTAKKYTVSFANVDAHAYPDVQVEENGTVNVEDPTDPDAIFLGWFTDEEMTMQFHINSTKVTKDITLYAKWKKNDSGITVTKRYNVTFNSNGGSAVTPQSVEEGKKAFKPVTPERVGYQFKGWFLNDTEYSFDNVVTRDIALVAKWDVLDAKIKAYGGYNESFYVEWADGAPSQASVKYKAHGASAWADADSELIRAKSGENSVARVDILGITAGNYDVKITTSNKSELSLENISVTAHDRSGYAHFNRQSSEAAYQGIGAYKDDGTLKDNALVIYVTDSNKDEAMSSVADKYKFKIPNYFANKWGNKQADGIGWWLNNAQYTKSEKNSNGDAIENKSSNTYDPNGGKLAFASLVADDIPICIRFIGAVFTPEGCTEYSSLNEGGTIGDNGHMARMKDLKNVTLEGVGSDATLDGWGIHFMVGDSSNGKGSSFEVRNLIFQNYPEDAVGMEGASATNKYTSAPVSRCWVHNNTFLPGYANPTADSDKAEGDGSCDFKRGEYFTLSYNYFDDCHKTNLVGASTSNWQYNITYHHNWWNNAQSRVPLIRNSNLHFYNNYVSVSGSNDYVHGMEGTSYLFSEANYYTNCKQIMRPSKGGHVKAWNNTYYGCYSNAGFPAYYHEADTREQSVPNDCKYYNGTSLSSFDTNPALFYYNAQTKQSDCLLDDAVSARAKVIQFAGTNDWGKNNPKKQGNSVHPVFKTNMLNKTPSSAVQVPDNGTLAIDLNQAKANGTVNGVLFAFDGKSGLIKAKGQILFFTLATEAEVSFTAEGKEADNLAELISTDGTVYASKATSATVVLPAGTYCISSGSGTLEGNNAKEVTITSLSFKSTAGAAQAKIENLNAAIDALPATITVNSGSLMNNVKTALSALNSTELENYKTQNADRWNKYQNALSQYSQAQIDDAEAKINAIGAVNESSYPAITAARTAYDALTSAQRQKVSNYDKLTAAEAAWANIAVTSVNNAISNLTDVSGWTVENGKTAVSEAITKYTEVKSAYDALTNEQKNTVVNYEKVTNGLTKLNAILTEIETAEAEAAALQQFTEALNGVTDTSALTKNECKAIIDLYEKLSPAKQAEYAENKTYKAIVEKYKEYANQSVVAIFTSGDTSLATSAGFTVNGNYNSKGSFEYNGKTYSGPLKLESSTSVSFSTAATNKMTLKLGTAGGQIKVDGNVYKDEDNDGFIVINDLTAGNHTITKASGDPNLCYVELEPSV